ncbi:MAG TPA: FAD-dependent oxidoreductase [Burkholderiales bacterium]
MKRLVLIGGGHSHVEILRRFARHPVAGVELVLVSPHADAPYSGMLPGWIAGHYARADCHIDLAALARFARCRFLRSACNGINAEAGLMFCGNGEHLEFDLVSVNIGSRSPAFETDGALEHAVAVRPVGQFVLKWEEVCRALASGSGPDRIAVVGAGAAGTEVLLSMQHRLKSVAPSAKVRFLLIGDQPDILPGHNERVRRIFRRVLAERGIFLHLGIPVQRVEPGAIRLRDGSTIEAGWIAWATGASAPLWPRSAGLATDDRGFILVNECLQSISHPGVFACGDVATLSEHPRPKSGVYAVRAGPRLAANLRRKLLGQALRAWKPQPHALALISTGDRHAVASRDQRALEGGWVWQWKDWIDRRFMERYRAT